GGLDIDVEDIATATLVNEDGAFALLSVDYLQRPRAFYIEAVTVDGGWYRWEFCAKDADAMYERQMARFVALCEGDTTPDYPNLADGIAVQEVLDEVSCV
ncbi:unnamed protein product, partial [marine sediment metagenome]